MNRALSYASTSLNSSIESLPSPSPTTVVQPMSHVILINGDLALTADPDTLKVECFTSTSMNMSNCNVNIQLVQLGVSTGLCNLLELDRFVMFSSVI